MSAGSRLHAVRHATPKRQSPHFLLQRRFGSTWQPIAVVDEDRNVDHCTGVIMCSDLKAAKLFVLKLSVDVLANVSSRTGVV